jgi:hypothetical protein
MVCECLRSHGSYVTTIHADFCRPRSHESSALDKRAQSPMDYAKQLSSTARMEQYGTKVKNTVDQAVGKMTGDGRDMIAARFSVMACPKLRRRFHTYAPPQCKGRPPVIACSARQTRMRERWKSLNKADPNSIWITIHHSFLTQSNPHEREPLEDISNGL